jgi:hypothetical protein
MGGFSFSSVPRQRSPFSCRRRPGRPFFDRLGTTFVSSDNVDFVVFDRAFERRFGLEVYDATAQESGHLMNVVLVGIEFPSDLLVREIEPHQIQAQNPLAQRLMVMREDRIGQVAKVAITSLAVIALPFTLALMQLASSDLVGLTPDASDAHSHSISHRLPNCRF